MSETKADAGSVPLRLGQGDSWSYPANQAYLIDTVFRDPELTRLICKHIAGNGIEFTGLGQVLSYLGEVINFLAEGGDASEQPRIAEYRKALEDYIAHVAQNDEILVTRFKRHRTQAFWPNPARYPDQGLSAVTPFSQSFPILDKSTRIGAAGSCFANEVTAALQDRGYNYVVTEPLADGSNGVLNEAYVTGMRKPDACAQWGILFNMPSFTQLAERAFGERDFRRILVRQVGESGIEMFGDIYREGILFKSEDAYLADYDRHLEAVRKALSSCEVFIITPGLNECWQLIEDGSVLSRNPKHSSVGALARARVLTYQENMDALQRFIDIVRHHNPKIKFIISVSPVPFMATYRAHERHVVEANTHSKAMLRVVVEEIVNRNPDVFYFPSYELVTVCDPDPWEKDLRHVKRATVARIMEMFHQMFVRGDSVG